ncbi:hypothetical protein BKA70DRAFT_1096781 [Coprinopsis sp. MPI-PUGE-AT-0042]|nr:hypothetical protein BKA70DRAFT_1096781 [Coprinopsis sp. MPI-PUGE-AT-0042]
MSELDSWSDSDWLDVADGHESEDNESISSRDTTSRSHSRRSSISSRGDVEAWEGYVDSSDEAPSAAVGTYPSPLALVGSADSQRMPLDLIPDIETEQEQAEDERVKEALDQSLIGTLNTSRTSATGQHTSGHTSVRDLRLSFPDPLTSSRNELNGSYEDVSQSETALSDAEGKEQPASQPVTEQVLATDPVKEVIETPATAADPTNVDLEIHLYGSSTEYKWTFVQDLLQRFADVSGQFIVKPLESSEGLVRSAVLEDDDEDSKVPFRNVTIYDRTEDNHVPEAMYESELPSLGIIFLPTIRLPALSMHSLYLPVLAKNDILGMAYNSEYALRSAAEDDWDMLMIPAFKRFPVKEVTKSIVATPAGIRDAESSEIRDSIEALLVGTNRKQLSKPSENSNSVNAVKLLALVSLVVGLAYNTPFQSSSPPAPTKTVGLVSHNTTWLSISAAPNQSTSHQLYHSKGAAHLVTSVKDMALSVYNPGTTSLSLTTERIKALTPASSQTPALLSCVTCNSALLAVKTTTKEVAELKSTPSALEECPSSSASSERPDDAAPAVTQAAEHVEETTSKALGLKFVDSLSEVLGVTTQALTKAVYEDGSELFESLDDIMSTLRTHTDEIIKQSKGKARALEEHLNTASEVLQARNDRARSRAKEIKKLGEEFLSYAGDHVKERTNIARRRARHIRQSVEELDPWQVYRATHDEWSGDQRDKPRRGSHTHHGRRCTRSRTADGRNRPSSAFCD